MSKKKILYFNPTELQDLDFEQQLLGGDEDYELVMVKGVPESDFLRYAADADAVALDAVDITDDILRQMPNCKVMVRRGIGFDCFHLDAFTKNGVLACNVPGYCQPEVALHHITLALSCLRNITVLNERLHRGDGNYDDIRMHRPASMVFGIISFGSIPRTMVPTLKALGFRVVAWDPYLPEEFFTQTQVERIAELDELLAMSDVVSVNTPLFEGTRNLISREAIAKIKKGAVVICTSRGGIIDEEALRDAILEGRISGCGLDVLADEVNFTTPLAGVKNAILTPHVAYYTEEAELDLRTQTLQYMYETLKNNTYPKSLLNRDVIGKSRLEK